MNYVKFLKACLAFVLITVSTSFFGAPTEKKAIGLWVPCESANASLSSLEKIDELLKVAKFVGITDLYIQVYRGNRSWFKNPLADDTPYQNFVKKENKDLLKYILVKAHVNKIKVHAWFNVFRIGKRPNAGIIKKIGKSVVTRDNLGTSMADYKNYELPSPYSKYFIYGEDGMCTIPCIKRSLFFKASKANKTTPSDPSRREI